MDAKVGLKYSHSSRHRPSTPFFLAYNLPRERLILNLRPSLFQIHHLSVETMT